MAVRLKKHDFYCDEQWDEHKQLLKIQGCRAYSKIEDRGRMFVQYSINLNDYRFMIEYHAEGGTSLYILKASFDNPGTLQELIDKKEQITLE